MDYKHLIVISGLSLFLLSILGYVSKSSYLKHIDTINIPIVTVETAEVEYNFDEQVTTALRERFRSKWREGADSELRMTIKDFRIDPIAFDANNQPEQLRMSLLLDYTFLDNKKNKVIDSKQDYVQIHDYFVATSSRGEPETTEVATQKLIEELCDDLYSNLAEQW